MKPTSIGAAIYQGRYTAEMPDDLQLQMPFIYRLLEALSIKYRLPSTRPRDALLTAMAVRLEHNATADRLRERTRIRPEELEELWAGAKRTLAANPNPQVQA